MAFAYVVLLASSVVGSASAIKWESCGTSSAGTPSRIHRGGIHPLLEEEDHLDACIGSLPSAHAMRKEIGSQVHPAGNLRPDRGAGADLRSEPASSRTGEVTETHVVLEEFLRATRLSYAGTNRNFKFYVQSEFGPNSLRFLLFPAAPSTAPVSIKRVTMSPDPAISGGNFTLALPATTSECP